MKVELGAQAERVRGQERIGERSLETMCSGTIHGESAFARVFKGKDMERKRSE